MCRSHSCTMYDEKFRAMKWFEFICSCTAPLKMNLKFFFLENCLKIQIVDVWEDEIDQKLNSFYDFTVNVKNRRGIDKIFKMLIKAGAFAHNGRKDWKHWNLQKKFRLNENFIFIFTGALGSIVPSKHSMDS